MRGTYPLHQIGCCLVWYRCKWKKNGISIKNIFHIQRNGKTTLSWFGLMWKRCSFLLVTFSLSRNGMFWKRPFQYFCHPIDNTRMVFFSSSISKHISGVLFSFIFFSKKSIYCVLGCFSKIIQCALWCRLFFSSKHRIANDLNANNCQNITKATSLNAIEAKVFQ